MKKIKLYIVKSEDTLAGIAAGFGVTVDSIVQYNPCLRHKRIYKGQPLNIVIEEPPTPPKPKAEVRVSPSGEIKRDRGQAAEFAAALTDAILVKVLYPTGSAPFEEKVDGVVESVSNRHLVPFLQVLKSSLLDLIAALRSKDVNKVKEALIVLDRGRQVESDPQKSELMKECSAAWRELTLNICQLDFVKAVPQIDESAKLLLPLWD